MKLIMENWRRYLTEIGKDWEAEAEKAGEPEPSRLNQLETIGDLRREIQKIQLAKRGKKGLTSATGVATAALLDLVPGGGTLKSVYDVARTMYNLPDDKKTNTGLDKLNVDDQVSKVVDDRIENAFLNDFSMYLKSFDDETPLEKLDVTELLGTYISDEFLKTIVAKPGGK